MWDKAGSAPLQEQPVTLCNPISQTRKPGPHCSALLMKTPCTKTRDHKDTARLALVSLAGTASATRATLLRCCHLQQRQENRACPSLVFSPQLQPSARLAPQQQSPGARCSGGDEGRGQAFIPAEDRGIGNKARVPGAAKRPGGAPQSPAF